MKKEIVIGSCFCLVGILCTCFFGYEYFATYGFLSEYHLTAFAEETPDLPLLFSNVLWERCKLFGLIGLVAMTPVRKLEPLVLRCAICFTAGVFLAACVGNLGMGGLLFFAASLLPHGAVYLLALLLLLGTDKQRYASSGAKNRWTKIARNVGIVFFILLGCVLEATAGVCLLRLVITFLVK
jgi:hypothetical protein